MSEKKYDVICTDFLEKVRQSATVSDELLVQTFAWLNEFANASFTVVPFDQKKDK